MRVVEPLQSSVSTTEQVVENYRKIKRTKKMRYFSIVMLKKLCL
jgi:hypothetical protein